MSDISTRAAGSDALPRPDVVGIRHRVTYDLPSEMMTNFPKLRDFTVPNGADVQGTERYDKIFAVAVD
jgi:hypothetical protein